MDKKLELTATLEGLIDEPTVIVSAIYDEVEYKAEITNFASCQHPTALLTDVACMNFICKNIQHAWYKFNESNTKIDLALNVFADTVINISLNCPKTGVDNLELKIVRLEKRLSVLDTCELVTSHKYPKWETLEEFKKLPDFKYFKIIENYTRLVVKNEIENVHSHRPGKIILGEAFNREYGMYQKDMTKLGELYYYDTAFTSCVSMTTDGCFTEHDTHPTAIIQTHGRDYPHVSITDRLLLETLKKQNTEPYADFPRSVQILVVNPYKCMSYWLIRYIERYVKGYLLLNHEQFAFRSVTVKINVSSKDNSCYIDIYRGKLPGNYGLFSHSTGPGNSVSCISKSLHIDGFAVLG
jgi:hypothetical protein